MKGATEKHHAQELMARAVATAPPDDEPVTEQDRRRLHAGLAWFSQHCGKGIPMEEVLAEFGLKPKEFPPEDTR